MGFFEDIIDSILATQQGMEDRAGEPLPPEPERNNSFTNSFRNPESPEVAEYERSAMGRDLAKLLSAPGRFAESVPGAMRDMGNAGVDMARSFGDATKKVTRGDFSPITSLVAPATPEPSPPAAEQLLARAAEMGPSTDGLVAERLAKLRGQSRGDTASYAMVGDSGASDPDYDNQSGSFSHSNKPALRDDNSAEALSKQFGVNPAIAEIVSRFMGIDPKSALSFLAGQVGHSKDSEINSTLDLMIRYGKDNPSALPIGIAKLRSLGMNDQDIQQKFNGFNPGKQ